MNHFDELVVRGVVRGVALGMGEPEDFEEPEVVRPVGGAAFRTLLCYGRDLFPFGRCGLLLSFPSCSRVLGLGEDESFD